MKTTVQLNNLRIAPRKVRLTAGLIKGQDAVKAQHVLNFLTKRAAHPLAKLLESALHNAENNFGLPKENLFVQEVIVNEGAKLKRFRPRAMGQAGPIQKKTSRVTIILEERVPGLKVKKQEAVEKKKEAVHHEPEEKTSKVAPTLRSEPRLPKTAGVNQKGVFGGIKNIGRKLFRRKSI